MFILKGWNYFRWDGIAHCEAVEKKAENKEENGQISGAQIQSTEDRNNKNAFEQWWLRPSDKSKLSSRWMIKDSLAY